MIFFLKTLWNDDHGASAAEYALILAIIGAAISVAATTLSGAIGDAINTAAEEISGANEG